MENLQSAARCRSESDWLIGINGTRAITTRMFGNRTRSRGTLATVGRVQTPTLAIVLDREKEIRGFSARNYWRLVADFEISEGNYEGVYQKPNYKKSDNAHDRIDRIWDKREADSVLAEARQSSRAQVSEEKKRTRQLSPLLYDLTTLQREGNNRFGYSARRTLQIAQSLYERHKLITYPRTDSRALPNDYLDTCRATLGNLRGDLQPFAEEVLKNSWLKPDRRIFNDAKVSDHFAIIPTGQESGSLSPEESKVYDMIARRFLAVFFPAAEFDVTVRRSALKEHVFRTEGKVMVIPGWMSIYNKSASGGDVLPALVASDGDPPEAAMKTIELVEDATRPPTRYTEATLLSAMEGAGKLVDDEELAEAMKEKGLGTPATRAQTIEQLINQKYIERQKRELLPTVKAESLIEFLNAVRAEVLTSPTMTGEWEYKLKEIENGRLTRADFMRGIAEATDQIITRTKAFKEADGAKELAILSPTNGKPMLESLRMYISQDEKIKIYKTLCGRKLVVDELKGLLDGQTIGPFEDFVSKAGKPFQASLRLKPDHRVEYVFVEKNENGADGNGVEAGTDLETLPVIGKCPKDGGRVMEAPKAFACEHHLDEKRTCDFRISRLMLEKSLPVEQMTKLLDEGKTDLIEKFRSKRTKKHFSAYLVLKKNGRIGFEFPPRPAKKEKSSAK
jgi:DNA topoisomerase-3